ncbi:SDR family NAD(P)-dependent oxidoreductase [Streptomyces acidicola]|uniref:SDR family oxidoreductase n=1 Tax=Streptomyces acidicola TaxID=2596892 RepID=A0A5N8WMS5_9ACTN|nr:SDR family oxidoreductase [Streptomyces acidicola]MPY48146.1 SDR family oxidoreductase [Streptomyces acidicola]
MAQELTGKVAVVTGGVSGIGRGIVDVFLEEGARIVVGDIDDEAGHALHKELGDDVTFQHTDVTVAADVEALIARAVSQYGGLNVMVNNAGALGEQSGLLDLDPDGFTRTTDLLLRSVVLGHTYAGRRMKEQGTGGSIVSMSSIAGIQAGLSSVSYDAAKAGVLQVARTATHELAPYKIRSNVIMPGLILTPIMAKGTDLDPSQYPAFVEALKEPLGELHPIGRGGLPRDLANAALFFAGDRSAFITGQHIAVDGGITSVSHLDMGAVVGKAFTAMGVTGVDPNFSAAAKHDSA